MIIIIEQQTELVLLIATEAMRRNRNERPVTAHDKSGTSNGCSKQPIHCVKNPERKQCTSKMLY